MTKTVKTPIGSLKYVTIKGEGRNGAMKGQPERMQYMASVVLKKDDAKFKEFKTQLDELWKEYAASKGLKAAPKSNGIKPVTIESDELDEYGNKKRVETDEVIVTFKTDVCWKKDNKKKDILVLQPSGKDITKAYQAADWSIGNDTLGIIHGTAMCNDVGGTHKISLYLTGIQLAGNLQKYTGTSIQAEEIADTEDIVFDEDIGDVSNINI